MKTSMQGVDVLAIHQYFVTLYLSIQPMPAEIYTEYYSNKSHKSAFLVGVVDRE